MVQKAKVVKSILATVGQILFALLLYLLGIAIIGLAVFPGAVLCYSVWSGTAGSPVPLRLFLLGFAVAAAYFFYGFCLILIVAVSRILLGWRLREGEYPMVSLGSVRWGCANALQLVVTVTFMDFILLTPFAPFFFRLMGAKVGRNVQINSKNCADLSLLEIGDGAVITSQSGVPHDVPRGAVYSGYPAVENRRWLKSMAALNRLPELQKTVRQLQAEMARLRAKVRAAD